jgi:hypothetical protein
MLFFGNVMNSTLSWKEALKQEHMPAITPKRSVDGSHTQNRGKQNKHN